MFFILIGMPFLSAAFSFNLIIFLGISIAFQATLLLWFWSIAKASNQRADDKFKRSMKPMSIGFIYIVLYSIFFCYFTVATSINSKPSPLPMWIVPLHLGAMISIFYGLWFTAKQFMTFSKGEEVKFIDFSSPFFLLWFFPIGVWFIQPKVNQLLVNNNNE